jgi:hypothetical protein
VRGRYEEILRLGAEVIVVSFVPPERLRGYRELHRWPFPVVADPECAAYRAFGLETAGWARLLRPRVMLRYFDLMRRGYPALPPREDFHQLGGDFVVDRDRKLVYAYRSDDPADRPPAEEVISALAKAARSAAPGPISSSPTSGASPASGRP